MGECHPVVVVWVFVLENYLFQIEMRFWEHLTTVDDEGLSGDELGFIGGQEKEIVSDISRSTKFFKRDCATHVF